MDLSQCQLYATRLADYTLDIQVKLAIVNELRDSIEIVQSQEYPKYLILLMPAFLTVLKLVDIDFVSTSPQQKLRITLLEIMHRFPQTDSLRPFASDLMQSLMDILQNDNEENASVALKIIVDLHKNFKFLVEDYVQPFFDFVQTTYKNMSIVVDRVFLENESAVTTPGSSDETLTRNIPKSTESFKVLTECPIIIALLFQLHKKYVGTNVPALVPLIIEVLSLQPEVQRNAHLQAAAEGKIFTGMSPLIRNKSSYSEFKALQVKTLSFIAYILRSFVPILKPFQQAIADAVVCLMKDCPANESVTRKELLVATRHIWFTDFRIAFLKYVDILLDENVLIGPGLTSRETLRPIAHSVLLDLLHHLRDDLTQDQISKIINICSKNLHDPSFNISMQMICLKLLINFIDRISSIPSKNEARILLVKILEAFDNRFAALQMSMPSIIDHLKKYPNQHSNTTEEDTSVYEIKSYMDIGCVQPVRTTLRYFEGSIDVIKDVKLLIKSLSQGIKSVTISLRACSSSQNKMNSIQDSPRGLEDQVDRYISILTNGLDCFDFFNTDILLREDSSESEPRAQNSPNIGTAIKEDKETFDIFSSIFTVIEPCIFQEIFEIRMQLLFDKMLKNSIVLVVPQFFLANASLSPNFAGLLLRFLVDRLEKLGSQDQTLTNVVLRLFKLIFMAITLFPEKNEPVLRLFLGNLIMSSMKMSAKAKVPLNYFLLLRALFRSISGGRFELLYQEVLPLLPVLFEGLNSLLAFSHKKHMRELFVELCLTVPVRLSVLLPYLSYLMRPLVFSLSAGPELVSQGLRTLELCVDNLTQEFLEPIMAPFIDDLMEGLWKHLKPLPYSQMHSHTAMRILGKLGGRNRRLLQNSKNLLFNSENDYTNLSVYFNINPLEQPYLLSLEKPLSVARNILDNHDEHPMNHKKALDFAKECLPLILNFDNQQILLAKNKKKAGSLSLKNSEMDVDMKEDVVSGMEFLPFSDPPAVSFDEIELMHNSLSKLCQCFFSAICIPSLFSEAWEILENLCSHFTLLSIAEGLNYKIHNYKENSVDEIYFERGFLMAIVEAISSEDDKQRQAAEDCIVKIHVVFKESVGMYMNVEAVPAFHLLAYMFCSNCYEQEPAKKNGGCIGISALSAKLELGTPWILNHETDFVKALLFVLKDSSPSISSCNLEEAIQTFSHVIKVCNRDDDGESSADRQNKFSNLISLLISELANSNAVVRDTIQLAFQLLADLTGNEVTEILTPVKERLLTPIFAKPLRALPFAMQMGHIDAITYCLTLRPPLLSFSEELVRLIQEALALADAEDQALVSKSNQYKNLASLTNLRVVCIKLLSAAMANSEFMSPRQATTRSRIISVFFKSLYSKSNDVVECAYKGLQQVLSQQQKLPKDLLQAGLRPILVNLSDHKRLSVSGLEGLGRLLELLTNYFKVEIGKKLLDHLKMWADPAMLEESSGKPLNEIEDIKVIVAILDIFCLLPASANIFMEEVVRELLSMESKLHRSSSSPFRKSVIKYLNRYAPEAVDFFYQRVTTPIYNSLFVSLLGSEHASVLRLEFMKTHSKFMQATLLFSNENSLEALERKKQGVLILRQVYKLQPDWLQEEIVEPLRLIWCGNSFLKSDHTETLSEKMGISNAVLDILMSVCRHNPGNIDLLIELLLAYEKEDILDCGIFKNFLFKHLSQTMSIENRHSLIERFFVIFVSNSPQKLKRNILRHLVIPMLMITAQNDVAVLSSILNAAVIDSMQNAVWSPMSTDSLEDIVMDDYLKVELLQLTALMIQYSPESISEIRKDIIKFVWKHFKVEDTFCKQSAYVVLSRFIREYDTPVKIVIQIYVALLRAFQPEGKVLVKQALDILLPILPKRVTDGDSKMATWVRWTRKIIIEDGHNTPQLVTIYQLILRHADQFYESRNYFIPHIIFSLVKLGLSPNATAETRGLTMDISEQLLKWEQQALSEGVSQQKDETEMDWTSETSSIRDSSAQETLLNYLISFSLSTNESLQVKGLAFRANELIRAFLVIWPSVNIKHNNFEKSLTVSEVGANINLISNAIDIFGNILENKSDDWTISNISEIQKYVDAWVKSNTPKLANHLENFVTKIIKITSKVGVATDMELPSDISNFYKSLEAHIQIGLRDAMCLEVTAALIEATFAIFENGFVFSADIIKAIQKVIKEFQALNNVPSSPSSPKQTDMASIIFKFITILNKTVSTMGDQRRIYLNCFNSLIELTDDEEILTSIINICRQWVFNKSDPFPTMKEKSNILYKMTAFETRNLDTLFDKFLELVADIYSDPSFIGTEITVKLESAFLLGASRKKNPDLSNRFLSILEGSVGNSIYSRLMYVLGTQNWEALADSFWITLALDLCLGAMDTTELISKASCNPKLPFGNLVNSLEAISLTSKEASISVSDKSNVQFMKKLASIKLTSLVKNLRSLIHTDINLAYSLWVQIFPVFWSSLAGRQRHDISKVLIPLLSKEYHMKQAEMRPNIVQCILDGIGYCIPPVQLPPQLLKYLGKTYNSWHTCIELLKTPLYPVKSGNNGSLQKEEERIRESFLDSITELYECIGEDDMVFGMWRNRSLFVETNAALSYEQIGMWALAQTSYENVQAKARSGVLPFSESEYSLWEQHWIKCTQHLQQWDILTDLSKSESNTSLLLESAWRLSDWQAEREMLSSNLNVFHDNDIRKQIFESFLLIQNYNETLCSVSEVQKSCDEGVQLIMRKWLGLPEYVSESHVPLLHSFQLFVEMSEACQIITNLQSTSATNIDSKSQELKGILQVWRDRLPNEWDDIDIWSDLVSWRQHVFTIINKAYLPLIPHLSQPSGSNGSPTSSYAYRGYHETAWIINRFAHVCRKHQLFDVCVNSLSKIYTLPNIEIQEAFFKLREQAKCHLQSPSEYAAGLDVINNTNLLYFSTSQKAEFFSMKGIFLGKLNLHEDAVQAFSASVQVDLKLPKAWGAWGQYNDRMFKENPGEIKYAASAVNCFLHAVGLYNSSHSQKYIARILWLLSFDDAQMNVGKAYDAYKGEMPLWYWITFIPQLLSSLANPKEARFARQILLKIAKTFPQALHFQLRTAKEDFLGSRKTSSVNGSRSQEEISSTVSSTDGKSDDKKEISFQSDSDINSTDGRNSWDYVEEIMAVLKTAFPLLALTMETMVDQILQRLKPSTDEDIYRLIVALLNDGVQMYMQQLARDPTNSGNLSSATEMNLLRFAESMAPNHIKYKAAFEKDFIDSKPNLSTLIQRFRKWRDNLETILDNRPKTKHLELFSHYLAEFEYTKFDEVEIPGQYFLIRNSNKDFIRIQRFSPIVNIIRGHTSCSRRVTIRGHDGSLHPFVLQHPAARHCRREERIVQLFRIFNSIFDHKKETRKRNLTFHLPMIVPLAPQIRLVQDDTSYVSLQDIFEDHCKQYGLSRDDPASYYTDRIRSVLLSEDGTKTKMEMQNLKLELFEEVAAKFVPETILAKYCTKRMKSFQDLYNLRKVFTKQMACNTLMTYTLSIGQRHPQKINISFKTGNLWLSELLPSISSSTILLTNSEAVPFRLTPNLQNFMTPGGIEGLFTSSLVSTSRALCESEFVLESYLSMFLKDELLSWQNMSRKSSTGWQETQFRDHIMQNVDLVMRRTKGLSCKEERERVGEKEEPVYQSVLDLISQAVNPMKLAQMDIGFLPQL